jgi:hypothetical protein
MSRFRVAKEANKKGKALVFSDLFSHFVVEAFFANPFEKQSVFPIVAFVNMGCKNLSNEPDVVPDFYHLNNFALNAQGALLN